MLHCSSDSLATMFLRKAGPIRAAMLVGLAFVGAPACASAPAVPVTAVAPARPAVELLDARGHPVALDSLRAPTTVVAFWASYCGACMAELPAVAQLAEQYRDDPRVAVIVISADAREQHDRARAVLADVAPAITGHFVNSERDLYPLMPRRPDGTPVVSLPMTLVIDAAGTWHYTYGGGKTESDYLAQHRKLIASAQAGKLVAATDPPQKSVALEIRPQARGYRFKVIRAPEDNTKVVETILEVMKGFGYPAHAIADARGEIERGLLAGRVEFVFEHPAG